MCGDEDVHGAHEQTTDKHVIDGIEVVITVEAIHVFRFFFDANKR